MAFDSWLATTLTTASAPGIMLIGVSWFLALYLGCALLNRLLTRRLLPALGHGGILDPRPLAAGQVGREVRASLGSVLVFGVGLVVPWSLIQAGWARFAVEPSLGRIVVEAVLLATWNEVHFYLCHRLLHTAALKRCHLPHHRSTVPTPWSTFSFHPVEALLLGSVIVPPMLVHDFSATALASLPLVSILFNGIGHSNYDFLPDFRRDRWWLNGARRHHLHHACYHGNYGFMFPFMDRWFGTELPIDAAAPIIARFRAAGPARPPAGSAGSGGSAGAASPAAAPDDGARS